jgi:hypothetical protein
VLLVKTIGNDDFIGPLFAFEMDEVAHRAGTTHARRIADLVKSPSWIELVWLEAQKHEIDITSRRRHQPPPRL